MKATLGLRDKFLEVTTHVKNREEILRLKVQLEAVKDDPIRAKSLRARIMVAEEANARMSIAPLIEAGELSTISENLTEADVALREGKMAAYLEKAVEQLPGWGRTAVKNILITKDTALFQGLNRMVQYGDFVAKAVLHDHLTQNKGMTSEEALLEVSEEFVNYNRLPGRGRDFLESNGLLWFFSYKLRIMKVALKMIQDRPFSALLLGQGRLPLTDVDVDTVLDSSLLGSGLEGRLDYSIGPEMGIDSPTLNPTRAPKRQCPGFQVAFSRIGGLSAIWLSGMGRDAYDGRTV